MIDSAWCCQLLEHGLVRPSFASWSTFSSRWIARVRSFYLGDAEPGQVAQPADVRRR